MRLLAIALVLAPCVLAAAEVPPGHRLAIGDYVGGRVCILERDGSISWEYPAPQVCDLAALADGHLLFTVGHGVVEVTRERREVFSYHCASEVFTCQRLADGTTLVGESTAGRIVIVDRAGAVVRSMSLLQPGEQGHHWYLANARLQDDGHLLASMYALQEVREYDALGRIVARLPAPSGARMVARLPGGRTLVSTGDYTHDPRLFEVDGTGAITWEVSARDLPPGMLLYVCGAHRLADGHTMLANFVGHGQFGKAPHLIEITPDKQVVWTWGDHARVRTVTTVQVLDAPAEAASWR